MVSLREQPRGLRRRQIGGRGSRSRSDLRRLPPAAGNRFHTLTEPWRPTFTSAVTPAIRGGGALAPPLQLWRRRSFSGLVQDQAGLTLFWEIGGFPDLLDLRQQEAPKLQTSPQLTGWKLSRVFVRLDPSLEGKIHKTCVAAPLESQNSSARRRPVSRVFSPVSSPHCSWQ